MFGLSDTSCKGQLSYLCSLLQPGADASATCSLTMGKRVSAAGGRVHASSIPLASIFSEFGNCRAFHFTAVLSCVFLPWLFSQPVYLSVSQKCLRTFCTLLLSGTVLDFNYFPPVIYRDLGSGGRWKSVCLFRCRDKELLSLHFIAMKYLGGFKLICQ